MRKRRPHPALALLRQAELAQKRLTTVGDPDKAAQYGRITSSLPALLKRKRRGR